MSLQLVLFFSTFSDTLICIHYIYNFFFGQHHAKNKKCFVCNKPTLGIFNTAHEIRKKMAEGKKEEMAEGK